jgi:hypothetical protein
MINRLVITQRSVAEQEYEGFDISPNETTVEILLGIANKKNKIILIII